MQKLNSLPLLFSLGLLACDEAEPVDLIPLPDAAPRPDATTHDATIHDAGRLDAEPEEPDSNVGPEDAEVDANEDAEVDAEVFGVPPERTLTKVLNGRQESALVFVRGGHLWLSSLALASEPSEPQDLGNAPNFENLDAETAFLGARTTSGPAWVFLPEGEDGELMARNVTSSPDSPVKTNLYPPARIAVGSEILLIGHSSADPESPIAWSVIASNGPEARTVDATGMPLPVSATPGLTGWIFAFADGQCAFLNSLETPVESWNCHALADSSVLAGNTNAFHTAIFESGPAYWSAMPSAAEAPEGASSFVPLVEDGTVEGQFPLSGGGIAFGLTAPDARFLATTKEGAYALPLPEGLETADVIGLAQNRGAWRAVYWDRENDGPLVADLSIESTVLPPTFVRRDSRCMSAIEPEDCSDSDRDCDGAPRLGLCCASSTVHTAANLESLRVDEPFYAAMSDDGLLLALVAAGEARLYSLPVGNASGTATLLASFEEVSRLTDFAHLLTRSILRAEYDVETVDEAGDLLVEKEESLLWYLGPDLTEKTEIPCDFKYMRIKDMDGRARFFCSDQALDHEPGAQLGSAVAYPAESGGGTLQWVTSHALGEEDLLLVALGEGYALELWRDGETLTRQVESESAIEAFKDLDVSQRAIPIQLTRDGLPARVRDARVEIFRDGLGFLPSSGSSWPIQAFLSPVEPIALSVGYNFDPATLASATQNSVTFYSHDLRPGASSSGRVAQLNRSNSNAQPTFRGLAQFDYSSASGQLPILVRGYGTESTLIEAFKLSCTSLE